MPWIAISSAREVKQAPAETETGLPGDVAFESKADIGRVESRSALRAPTIMRQARTNYFPLVLVLRLRTTPVNDITHVVEY